MRGTLFLIVGPSGAGKDSLIDAARAALGARFVFPQRIITRLAASGEDHIPCDEATFAREETAGAFALSWRAHNLCYGIPASIAADLTAGRHVIVNVSRDIVETARGQFKPTRVIEVTAQPVLRAERLRRRGRELDADLEERLARERSVAADATIVNDGALEAAVGAFLAVLRG
jgi:phosphonate metabolism protein PhnN/1,5-bisphosphokinase (PRPP-forming)